MDEFSSQLNIVSSCEAHHDGHHTTHSADSVMTSDDRVIYNMLRRSAAGKPTYESFGLEQAEKRAILWKTGPCPKWYTPWRKREFTLKGNFLYYYKVKSKNIGNSTVRGAIYIRGAAINEEKVKGSNKVIMITPPVPRRADWKDDETSIFYIKCDSKMQQHEWCKVLKEVANRRTKL